MRTTPYRTVRCPQCYARPGSACHDKQGQAMPGVHFQRTTAGRRNFALAINLLYSPLPKTADSYQLTANS